MAPVPEWGGGLFFPGFRMNLMFHLVAKEYFDSISPDRDYVPPSFERDGFIHCTDASDEMTLVANRLYGKETGSHLYLFIDKDRVRAPIRYEDKEKKYPHIYGALNRDAIAAVCLADRDPAGRFLPPEGGPDGSDL